VIARVSRRGAARWTARLHPWIYRSDVLEAPDGEAGITRVVDERGHDIGMALWSPVSTIALRMLTHEATDIGPAFWRARVAAAAAYRATLRIDSTAYRVIHAEADALPSLVVDRYGDVLVVQFLSAGIERYRGEITDALVEALGPAGVLARDDVPVRSHERLPGGVHVLQGDVPETSTIREAAIHWLAALRTGQKTGAFLDQRENRTLAASLARGRALDAFAYHGAFALQMAHAGAQVLAIESSAEALARARENVSLNQLDGRVDCLEANVFDALRDFQDAGDRFDVIVLDPPAFAKRRDSVEAALRGYKEINLRAMKLLEPGGHLLTFSCSWHVGADRFRAMLEDAAADAGRPIRWVEWRGQAGDHPAIVQIPETAYLKGAILQAI
jgi:23S rRNA (cytosine1962-C5)-methyltransferase